MSTGTTPSIGLLLGDDALANENWQKLDRAYRALFRSIIPDSTVIQGDLEVAGNTKLDGTLEVVGATTLDGPTTTFDLHTKGFLTVDGGIALPPFSLDATALKQGAAVYTAQTGVAQTGQLALTASLQDMCEIILSPADDPARWSLVLASLCFQVGMSGDNVGGLSQGLTANLTRGQAGSTTVQQARNANYTQTRAGYLDLPMTMVRVTKPPASSQARWAIEAKLSTAANALTITRTFAQMSVLQLT